MADVTCPNCRTVTELPAIRRSADEFCRNCDYPLFWTPSAAPVTTPGGNATATLRRLPGAGGRQRIGTKVCPECGELNPVGETHCIRCGSDLDPKPPEPELEPIPEPEPIAVAPIAVAPPKRAWWPWVVYAVCVAILAVAIITTY